MPNNFESIFGGMFRGLASNKSSGGLNQTNTQNASNPQTYQWIGQASGGTVFPINREQTQNPALPFAFGSAGISLSYANPVLTDIPTLLSQGSPGTDVSQRDAAGSVGSPTNIPATYASLSGGYIGNGYGMSPQNADHFKTFFANQIGLSNKLPKASAFNTSLAITDQADTHIGSSQDSWKNAWNVFSSMQKGYSPMGSIARW